MGFTPFEKFEQFFGGPSSFSKILVGQDDARRRVRRHQLQDAGENVLAAVAKNMFCAADSTSSLKIVEAISKACSARCRGSSAIAENIPHGTALFGLAGAPYDGITTRKV